MNEKEILKKYKLTDDEHNEYYDIIKRIYVDGKMPQENPIAIIVGGQTGAGKSGILGYSSKMFENNNVIIINSDEIKSFHPKSEEIAKLYPQLYTKITDQESNIWTSRLFEELRRNKYNIIFEGTMKNNRIADESIAELKKIGYTVVVRGIAVCDLESRISILERYEGQVITKGWGRLVIPEHHNQTYDGMPNTIDYIEKSGLYDVLEIYKRGDILSEPILVYANHNKENQIKTDRILKDKNCISKKSEKNGYNDAKGAVNKIRENEYKYVMPHAKNRLKNVWESMKKREASNVEKAMIIDVFNMVEKIKNQGLER